MTYIKRKYIVRRQKCVVSILSTCTHIKNEYLNTTVVYIAIKTKIPGYTETS